MAMNAVTDGTRDPYARFWEQLAEVRLRNPDTNFLVAPDEATPGSGIPPSYVYEAQAMLARSADMHRIRPHARARVDDSLVPGLSKLIFENGTHIPTEAGRINGAAQRDMPAGPRRSMVTPNHLVSIAPVNLCPAGEPRPVLPGTPLWPDSQPSMAGADIPAPAGAGISVFVIDTGFLPDVASGHPMLADVQVLSDESARMPVDPDGLIKEYAGHGTFITGVLRAAAPGVQVTVSSALQNAGTVSEECLGGLILSRLEDLAGGPGKPWPHIISLSAGATTLDNQELMGLGPLLDRLATDQRHTVLIAAAGNDGTSQNLFWPAACAPDHPGVISVGALRRDGLGRACFSNHGGWVKVFAYGENVINLFRPGQYPYHHDSYAACRYYPQPPLYFNCGCVTPVIHKGDVVTFTGQAQWNGTSFATPLVAGRIAAHMTKIGEKSDARRAAQDLLGRYAKTIVDQGDHHEVLRALT
jgi:subtilisin family serine protease